MNVWPGNIGNKKLDKWLRRGALGVIVFMLFVGLPAIATVVSDGGAAQVPKGTHLVKDMKAPILPTTVKIDGRKVHVATRDAFANKSYPIISCAPWGHPNCVMDIHPLGQYYQPLCQCNGGPAFNCCGGYGQPC